MLTSLLNEPFKLAVILQQQLNSPTRFTGTSEQIPRFVVLLAADCGCRHSAAVMARSVQCKRAPAGADFEHVILRPQLQLAADAVQLLDLRVFQRIVGPR